MTTKSDAKAQQRWLGVVRWMSAMIWAHGPTPEAAAVAAAKQARRDLSHYIKGKAKVEWTVNLYEVEGLDWSYDDWTGFQTEDGRVLKVSQHQKVQA